MKNSMTKSKIIGLLVIAWITISISLIYFDDSHSIERQSYVKKWSQSITYDLYEKLHTRGVFTSESSTPIYFDNHVGSFKEFLVKNGDRVDIGDSLYTYEVVNYGRQKTQIETEIEQLQLEIDSIEDYIRDVKDYTFSSGETNSSNNDSSSYAETEFTQLESIAAAERELSKKESLLDSVENQLDQLKETGQEITVTSPISAIVTDKSKSLQSPILTLQSTNLLIEGELSEKERTLVEENMSTEIYVSSLSKELTGTLDFIRTFPENVDIHRSSRYPYEVTIDQQDQAILPGYHADLAITLNQSNQTVTVLEDLIVEKNSLSTWVMNSKGRLEKRRIETGIMENGLIEITDGLKEGEWLAYKQPDQFRNGSVFITPIQPKNLHLQEVVNTNEEVKRTYALLGLLSR